MNIISLKDTAKLYYVGGVVRDELLGIKSLDVDIVYEGNAISAVTQSEIAVKIGTDRDVEGLKVLRVNPDFGTVRVEISGQEVDIASSRTEKYEKKGHLPQIEKIGCSLREDVLRRDFTVNSLYKSFTTGEILDFTGGLEDLKNKKLRILHEKSFIDDPTRIIRALKFSARFGFELDENSRKLRDEYLQNINYDMCFKRVKKELMETLSLNRDDVFEKFIDEKIYKLVTEKEVSLPQISIENLIKKYAPKSENIWLIYAGILHDLTRLELTRKEQKILDDFSTLENQKMSDDFEIYKAFEGAEIESVILYAVLKNEKIACRYLDDLCKIKIQINGKILESMGVEPSPKYKEIFDFILREKIKNPNLTLDDEKNLAITFLKIS